jgi:nicotinamidase-related amidase
MGDGCGTALLLVDVVNPLDFDGGEALFEHAMPAVRNIARLRRRAREEGLPAIYVNDNFDAWHLGFRELIERFRAPGVRGAPLVEMLEPDPKDDLFVLKPLHSGFYKTSLDVLLDRLRVHTVIVTGLAGDFCVLFTANDAYMRGFDVIVPSDCVASEKPSDNEQALRQMRRALKADTRAADELDLREVARRNRERTPRGARPEGTGDRCRRAADHDAA